MTKARASQAPVRSAAYRQKQRKNIIRRRLRGTSPELATGKAWTAEHKSLLGTMADGELAARTGHPPSSVRTMRQKLRIPPFRQ
jgi:hypothetical protein